MDKEVREVVTERLRLLGTLAQHRVIRKNDIAERPRHSRMGGLRGRRKRQDVGGLVLSAPSPVQGLHRSVGGEQDADLHRFLGGIRCDGEPGLHGPDHERFEVRHHVVPACVLDGDVDFGLDHELGRRRGFGLQSDSCSPWAADS